MNGVLVEILAGDEPLQFTMGVDCKPQQQVGFFFAHKRDAKGKGRTDRQVAEADRAEQAEAPTDRGGLVDRKREGVVVCKQG